MNNTPKANRLHIAIFGRTNVGKSSFLNMITDQEASIVSSKAGTTTDVVEKTMELLPIGPVVFLDTAGLDDASDLASLRIKKTYKTFERADVAILMTEAEVWGDYEETILKETKKRKIPVLCVINKTDLKIPSEKFLKKINEKTDAVITISATDEKNRENYINAFKNKLISLIPDDFLRPPSIIGDLLPAGGLAVLVVPIDLQAPKGRLILPQVQTIRDALDNDAAALVVKERELSYILNNLKTPPDIVVCDSQIVLKMCADTPNHVPATTFSILFSRYKGDLTEQAKGAAYLYDLKPGDKILIAEACTHHPIEDDIGRVKIPRWLRQYVGADLEIDVYSGKDYPENVKEYKLIIHCGGCVMNRKAMLNRIRTAKELGVPITNYGITISFLQGVLKRTLSPFPAALNAFEKELAKLKRKKIAG
jgi:[FeFe] hydrogenase H-cluster maturation GTPase HydF